MASTAAVLLQTNAGISSALSVEHPQPLAGERQPPHSDRWPAEITARPGYSLLNQGRRFLDAGNE